MARKKKTMGTMKTSTANFSGRARNSIAVCDFDYRAVFDYGKALSKTPEVVSLVSSREELLSDLRLGFESAHPGYTLACVPMAPEVTISVDADTPGGQGHASLWAFDKR